MVSKASVRFRTALARTAESGKAELDLGSTARLAQSVKRKALNLVVVGSSHTVGVLPSVGFVVAAFCALPGCFGSSYVSMSKATHKIAERGFDPRTFGL